MKKYLFVLDAPVKRPDAEGLGEQRRFDIWLDRPLATFGHVVQGFRDQYPPADICYWQPRTRITVNGEETFNCGDKAFTMLRSRDDADDERRMVRMRAEL